MMPAIRIFLLCAVGAWAQSNPMIDGLEAFQRGDYGAAETAFRKAPSDPRAAAMLAVTLAATSRCNEALSGLNTGFANTQGDTRKLAGLALAQCHLGVSRFDDAAEVLAKLRTEDPADADVLYLSARLQMRQWNDTLYQLYQKNPSSFRVNQISGEVLETQGRFNEAAEEYRKAIAKSPGTLNLHYRLGRALLMTSHEPSVLVAALAEFRAEVALNPHDAVAWYQVAQIQIAQHESPVDALQRAIDLDPRFPEPLVALGKLRLEQKDYESAITLLSKAAELAPASEAAHYNLMMAYRNAGRMADARREKAVLDKLQKTPEGEFTEFLKKLGESAPKK